MTTGKLGFLCGSTRSGLFSSHGNSGPLLTILSYAAGQLAVLLQAGRSSQVVRLRCLMAGLGLALIVTGHASAASPAVNRPVATPPLFHGNWCGLGDANRAAPVDALDAACRAHDLCYERLGRGACPCDRTFLRATASLSRNPRLEETVRSKAAFINSLFGVALCTEISAASRGLTKR